MENKNLMVFTNEFPYGMISETFLDAEVSFYNKFNKVIFIPISLNSNSSNSIRDISVNNYSVVSIPEKNFTKIESRIRFLGLFFFRSQFRREFIKAYKKKGIAGGREVLSFTMKGDYCVSCLKKILTKSVIDSSVFYSYWFHLPAYVAAKLAKGRKIKSVCRCHGYDLYEYRNGGYLPYRQYLLNSFNNIVCISNDGLNYLKNKYPLYSNKYSLGRLGTIDLDIENGETDIFTIVSCSRMISIKRIDCIVKALSLVNKKIKWYHFGDGPEKDNIIKCANQYLAESNIDYYFMGQKTNNEVLEFYSRNYICCFLNTSITEGIPVSIMEAMSFGIPIIATNVGGVHEIVADTKNGYLLNKNFTIEKLAEMIDKLYCMWESDKRDYMFLRTNSREIWENKYSIKNYKKFVEEVL